MSSDAQPQAEVERSIRAAGWWPEFCGRVKSLQQQGHSLAEAMRLARDDFSLRMLKQAGTEGEVPPQVDTAGGATAVEPVGAALLSDFNGKPSSNLPPLPTYDPPPLV